MQVSRFNVLDHFSKVVRVRPEQLDTIRLMGDAPKFVFTPEVIDFRDDHDSDYRKSMEATVAAGHTELPHSPMLVEYDSVSENGLPIRMFWLLEGGVRSGMYTLRHANIEGDRVYLPERRVPLLVNSAGLISCDSNDEITQLLASLAIKAFLFAMALHVRGIVVRQPRPIDPKLARARLKRGLLPETKDYVTVHIGFVTDRNGRRHDHSEGTGGHKRIHLRRGHTRSQPCGKDLQDRRDVWIKPVLVNYRPGVQMAEATYLVVP